MQLAFLVLLKLSSAHTSYNGLKCIKAEYPLDDATAAQLLEKKIQITQEGEMKIDESLVIKPLPPGKILQDSYNSIPYKKIYETDIKRLHFHDKLVNELSSEGLFPYHVQCLESDEQYLLFFVPHNRTSIAFHEHVNNLTLAETKDAYLDMLRLFERIGDLGGVFKSIQTEGFNLSPSGKPYFYPLMLLSICEKGARVPSFRTWGPRTKTVVLPKKLNEKVSEAAQERWNIFNFFELIESYAKNLKTKKMGTDEVKILKRFSFKMNSLSYLAKSSFALETSWDEVRKFLNCWGTSSGRLAELTEELEIRQANYLRTLEIRASLPQKHKFLNALNKIDNEIQQLFGSPQEISTQ